MHTIYFIQLTYFENSFILSLNYNCIPLQWYIIKADIKCAPFCIFNTAMISTFLMWDFLNTQVAHGTQGKLLTFLDNYSKSNVRCYIETREMYWGSSNKLDTQALLAILLSKTQNFQFRLSRMISKRSLNKMNLPI